MNTTPATQLPADPTAVFAFPEDLADTTPLQVKRERMARANARYFRLLDEAVARAASRSPRSAKP